MIAVIDYGASNLQSVCNALTTLNQPFQVVSNIAELLHFKKMILPGVGAAGSAMNALEQQGFGTILKNVSVPFLGICLGLQLLSEFSEENQTPCLGIIPGQVKKFPPNPGLKIPQIGWNQVELLKKSPLFDGVPQNHHFYFVNSYYFDAAPAFVSAKTLYGVPFASVVQKENFYGVQFHPEKSGEIGLRLLQNFCQKC